MQLFLNRVGVFMPRRLTAAVFAVALASSGLGGVAHAETWQCAPFARLMSGISLFGNAWSWWEQATGKYAKGFTPAAGAVLVFKPYGSMREGHVAVVSQVLTDRIIQVTHANWSPIGGKRGQVEKDVTVVDVSTQGDWSQVKVWYDPTRQLGTTVYPTYGFIYQAAQKAAEKAADAYAGALASATAAVTAVASGPR